MHKLLLIVGPTASGKTQLGLHLAKKFAGEILSADSRQVYVGMDVGTGKDIPPHLKPTASPLRWRGKSIPYYNIGGVKSPRPKRPGLQPMNRLKLRTDQYDWSGTGVKLWGYDLVKPDENFNAAYFQEIASIVIKNVWKENKLPIVVGGTGLYVNAITEPLGRLHIPQDKKLRKTLAYKSLQELQDELKRQNFTHWSRMNTSDRKNPRRLIRAIEVKTYELDHPHYHREADQPKPDSTLWIGLTAPRAVIYKRIDERVQKRIEQNAEEEVKNLVKNGYHFDFPAMSAISYRQWKPYFEGKKTKEEVVTSWKFAEHAYARRQLTWFKKNKKINWFNTTDPQAKLRVEEKVAQWYSDP